MAISYDLIFGLVKRFMEEGDFSDEKIKELVKRIKDTEINCLLSIFISGTLRLYQDDYEKIKADICKLAILDDFNNYDKGDRAKAVGVILSGFNIEIDDFALLLDEAQSRIEYEEIRDADLPF